MDVVTASDGPDGMAKLAGLFVKMRAHLLTRDGCRAASVGWPV